MTHSTPKHTFIDPGHWDETIMHAVAELETTLSVGSKQSIRHARRHLLDTLKAATDAWIHYRRPDVDVAQRQSEAEKP